MPSTCYICQLGFKLEGKRKTYASHGAALDGTWCSPRSYKLAYPATSEVDPTVGFVWPKDSNTSMFPALVRVSGACPTCGVSQGKYHHLGCTTEICPRHSTSTLATCGCEIVWFGIATTVLASAASGSADQYGLVRLGLTVQPWLLPPSGYSSVVSGGFTGTHGPPYEPLTAFPAFDGRLT
jgi:hypothetical protein